MPSISTPHSVEAMPKGSDRGCGWRSVAIPISGCSSDAVTWKASVITPILGIGQVEFDLQQRIDRRQHRLHHVVDHVTQADRHQHAQDVSVAGPGVTEGWVVERIENPPSCLHDLHLSDILRNESVARPSARGFSPARGQPGCRMANWTASILVRIIYQIGTGICHEFFKMAKLSQGSSVTIRSSGVDAERRRLNTWQAIRADVLGRIRSGEWPPGSLIPTEQMLSIEMGCARATVNRALRELADSGIIQRRRKVGTRVTATTSRRTTLSLPSCATRSNRLARAMPIR